jgi:hypothetical protein
MNDSTDPGGDPELEDELERYVLGRMTPTERAVFEARREGDPALNEAVAREREILEGVRMLGRTEIKTMLASAAMRGPRPPVGFWRITALAATVFIVTGIALWQGWFHPRGPAGLQQAAAPHDRPRGEEVARSNKNLATNEDVAETRDYTLGGLVIGRELADGSLMKSERGQDDASRTVPREFAARPENRMRQKDAKGGTVAASGGRKHLRVLVADARWPAAAAESDAVASDTISFVARVRGDSVTIVLPAHLPGLGAAAAADARVTRLSKDSVLIEAGGYRIRGYLPERVVPNERW